MGMEEPDIMILGDAEGDERVKLSAADFRVLSKLVNSKDYRAAIASAQTEGCPPAFDTVVNIELRYDDGTSENVVDLGGCLGINESRNPLNAFLEQLRDLKNDALSCPLPWDDGDPVPDVRPLCSACGGRC